MKFNLLVLDFDDTLFPSSILKKNQNLNPEDVHEVDDVACKLIIKYISLDFHIVIITNSQLAWFITITEKYLPKFLSLITNCSIRTISANDIYSCIYPEDFIKWKYCAYEDYILKHLLIDDSKGYVKNNVKYSDIYVLSVGDSQIDMIATSYLNKGNVSKLCNVKTKFIKYRDNPDIQILVNQTNFVINNATLLDNLQKPTTLYINLPDPFTIPHENSSSLNNSPVNITTIMDSSIVYQDPPNINFISDVSTRNTITNDTIFEFSDIHEPPQEIHSPPKRECMEFGEKMFQEIFFSKPVSPEPYF